LSAGTTVSTFSVCAEERRRLRKQKGDGPERKNEEDGERRTSKRRKTGRGKKTTKQAGCLKGAWIRSQVGVRGKENGDGRGKGEKRKTRTDTNHKTKEHSKKKKKRDNE